MKAIVNLLAVVVVFVFVFSAAEVLAQADIRSGEAAQAVSASIDATTADAVATGYCLRAELGANAPAAALKAFLKENAGKWTREARDYYTQLYKSYVDEARILCEGEAPHSYHFK